LTNSKQVAVAVFCAAALLSSRALAAGGPVVAILELRNKLPAADAALADTGFLTDLIRAQFLELVPDAGIITRENILVLLEAQGKTLDECEGECEVDTGRRLGADLVVSGELLRFSDSYRINLRLHTTQTARLISAAVASGTSFGVLETDLARAMRKLTEPLGPAGPRRGYTRDDPASRWNNYGFDWWMELRGFGGVQVTSAILLSHLTDNMVGMYGGGFHIGVTPLAPPDLSRGQSYWFAGHFSAGADFIRGQIKYENDQTNIRLGTSIIRYPAVAISLGIGVEWLVGGFSPSLDAWSGWGFGLDLVPSYEYRLQTDSFDRGSYCAGVELFLEKVSKRLVRSSRFHGKFFVGAGVASRSGNGVATGSAYSGLALTL
jgi:hypothetical protein